MQYIRYILALFVITVFLPVTVFALGVSPTPIVRDNVANGVKMRESVTILRSDDSSDALIEVMLSGGDSAKYIELSKEKFLIPKGEKRIEYEFFIAPEGAPNGEHTAFLTFVKKSVGGDISGSGATVQEAIGARVLFTVTDKEVKSLVIGDVVFEEVEVGLPLSFSFYAENIGNVDVRPDRVVLTVVDVTDDTYRFAKEFGTDDIELIEPSEKKRIQLMFNETLPQGEYKAHVVFYLDGQELYKTNPISVKVHPPGTLGQGAEFVSFYTERDIVAKDDLVEFVGKIKNTGDIGFNATFYVEIRKDGKRIDLIRSKDNFILKNQQGDFRENFRFTEYGEYEVEGYFEYGANRTEHKTLYVSVPKENNVSLSMKILVIMGALLLLGIIVVSGMMIRKKYKNHDK